MENFKTIKKIISIGMVSLMIFTCSACSKKPGGEDISSSGFSSIDEAYSSDLLGLEDVSSEEVALSSNNTSSVASQSKPSGGKNQTTTKGTKVFKVEDYGAVGDGSTNDGTAISKAIVAACADTSENKIVQFAANKSYRITSVPSANSYNRLFCLEYADNVHINGSNTKLLLKAPVRVGTFSNTNNCSFSGFVIDYSPKPFFIGTVTAIGSNYIDFDTAENISIPSGWSAPSTFFAFRNKPNERLHFNSTGYTSLGNKKLRFNMASVSTGKPGNAVIGEEFVLPMPGYSHGDGGGGAFSINKSSNFAMSNVRILSLPEFGFDIRCNEGKLSFDNVDFRQLDNINLVCWRDGFHVKDNSAPITWTNCDIGPIGDDAFNISSVAMKVTSINNSKDIFDLEPMEGVGVYSARPALKAGDEFVAYDNFTGELIGEGKIETVLNNQVVAFKSNVSLAKAKTGMYICFYSYANPNFLVKDCNIEGTVRARSMGTFENCTFNIYWLKVENETYFEGPIPKNLTFKNCLFKSLSGRTKNIVTIGTRYKNNPNLPAEYKCKNIVFESCTWENGTTYSVETGNQVIVR
ncbi:MAG: hypothetical protein PHV07_03435 [Oscillospiraceae bacterium]|nr:hypothetical protein [Oscillospiraceae bacterium]